MGRITNVNSNSEGIVREVKLIMPNRRVTKRAINQLIPLELGDPEEPLVADPIQNNENDRENMEENQKNQRSGQRYNLRRKPRVNYDRMHHGVFSSIIALAIMSLISPALSVTVKPPVKMAIGNAYGSLHCTTDGIVMLMTAVQSYELCAEGYCINRNNPPPEETDTVPA